MDVYVIPDEFVSRSSPNEIVARVYGPDIPSLDDPRARALLLDKAVMMGLITPGVSDIGGCIPAGDEDKKYGKWWREIRIQGSV